jgi:hypothetical protein
MPLVALDPSFGPGRILIAFFSPLGVGLVAKDVLEPLLIGSATSLTPGDPPARTRSVAARPPPCVAHACTHSVPIAMPVAGAVAVLLSVMIWGSVWGITGMVLAVPLTAVLRIYLAGLEHPLPRYCALVLAGRRDDVQGSKVAPL